MSFRDKDCQVLATQISNNESVCLVGMKKVGVSTFVRYLFLKSNNTPVLFPKLSKTIICFLRSK